LLSSVVGVAADVPPRVGWVERRRIDRRATARTKATARAARPASWAPMMGTPSESADVSAIGRVCAF